MTNLVFLDTETTGLNHDLCEIWEIGAIVRTDAGDVEYCWQIRPSLEHAEPTGLRISRYYQRLHHDLRGQGSGYAQRIAHPDLNVKATGTSARSIAATLAQLLDGTFIVGAVPWFDERFLQRFLRNYDQCATNNYHLVDVETLAAGALKLPPKWNFDQLLDAYGLTYDEADRHTALGDARMVRDLYDAVMTRSEA